VWEKITNHEKKLHKQFFNSAMLVELKRKQDELE